MPMETEQENVFGTADGSTFSAVLSNADGRLTVHSLSIDGHNVAAPHGAWATREEAVKALEDYAKGDRQP
ncbi:MAG: hypothetical protein EOO29_22215 [Comamonadaceae bacterium]|nr:MAG: hypothetical protein EOO29_22215 [Comamonadaceae bacterium]